MKKMLKTLFTCVVGATTCLLCNQTEAEALRYESELRGYYQVMIEGTDTNSDGLLDAGEMDLEIQYEDGDGSAFRWDIDGTAFTATSIDLSVQQPQKVSIVPFLAGYVDDTAGGGVPLFVDLWGFGFGPIEVFWRELTFSSAPSAPTVVEPVVNPTVSGEQPTAPTSTPEPSLSLLGFITLGGFMLGSRKKEKA